jgi:hypothetical protein
VWTKLTASVTEFVESIKMMVDAIGIDHVGIGSDNDLLSRRVSAGTNRAWAGTGERVLLCGCQRNAPLQVYG